jgi:hypothetical protein
MHTIQTRNYNCKDEELPVICGYAAFTLKRDLTDFEGFSPKFDGNYVEEFDLKIAAASELVNPKIETAEIKTITARMYAAADGLIDPINRLEGYVKLAGSQIPVSIADFGIPPLRKKINHKDMEGVLQNLRLVTANTHKYRQPLEAEGLNCHLIAHLEEAASAIAADNELQYEILTRRIELVKSNVNVLNELFAQLTEICSIGKILYRRTAPEKAKEYTFSYLLKKVRHESKHKPERNGAAAQALKATERILKTTE